jgi:hypothetical protein
MSETTASNFINANVRVGDICILKSQFTVGVPLMTVSRTDGENLVVSWFDGDNIYHEEIVNKKALFKYTGQTLQ